MILTSPPTINKRDKFMISCHNSYPTTEELE